MHMQSINTRPSFLPRGAGSEISQLGAEMKEVNAAQLEWQTSCLPGTPIIKSEMM